MESGEGICYRSATKLVEEMRLGVIRVEDVVRAFLNRIKEQNSRINAVVDLRSAEDLLQEARAKDRAVLTGAALGPLHGLPMTVKDSYQVSGLITSNGHPSYRNYRSKTDAELIKHLKHAGVIIMGKTNLPLLSIDWQSANRWFGRTNNPYDLSRVPGGSSGGSAAALAAGMTPAELGSDAGGSIRVPAHFCGVCGLRPTDTALSNRGQFKFPDKPQGHRMLIVPGPMARSVSDLLLLMPVLWSGGDRLAEIPPVPFETNAWNDGQLAIRYEVNLNDAEVDAEYEEMIRSFLKRVAAAGHSVDRGTPEYDEAAAYPLHGRLLGREIDSSSPTPPWLTRLGMYPYVAFQYRDKRWAAGVRDGIGMSARMFAETLDQKESLSDAFDSFLKTCDVWITPVASLAAFEHCRTGSPLRVNGKKVAYTRALAPFEFTTALSGHPIVVIPVGQTRQGLPLGVQIHSRKWSDRRLLEIAAHLESFTPGFQEPHA